MSRDIRPMPSSASGNSILVPFPDLAKPAEGEWELNVTLHDNGWGGEAKITLLQIDAEGEETELGSKTVTVTTSPTVYNVPLSGGLDESAVGRCNLSQLFLQIESRPFECCWFEGEVPTSLTLSDGTDSIAMTKLAEYLSWEGTGDIAGCTNVTVAMVCVVSTSPVFYFTINSSPALFCAMTGSCMPAVDLSCTITGCDSTTYNLTVTE